MNKALVAVLLPAFLFVLAPSASAAPVSVSDVYDPSADIFLASYWVRTHSWTHDIIDDGFNPTTDTIIDAELSVRLRDDWNPRTNGEEYKLFFEGNLLGRHRVNLIGAVGRTTVFVDISYLQADGKLSVQIYASAGDFYFLDSTLAVTFNTPMPPPPGGGGSPAVPEPAAVLLLGLGAGVAGLGLRRRKARAAS